MDVVTLSRIQFGVTTALHFLFVPLTLGMVWFVAIFQTMYYRTGEERWPACLDRAARSSRPCSRLLTPGQLP